MNATSDVSSWVRWRGEAARVPCAGASERQRLGDAPTLDVVGYKLPSPSGEEMPRTSVHVVQVLVPLAVANMVWLHVCTAVVVLRPKLTHKSLSVRIRNAGVAS